VSRPCWPSVRNLLIEQGICPRKRRKAAKPARCAQRTRAAAFISPVATDRAPAARHLSANEKIWLPHLRHQPLGSGSEGRTKGCSVGKRYNDHAQAAEPIPAGIICVIVAGSVGRAQDAGREPAGSVSTRTRWTAEAIPDSDLDRRPTVRRQTETVARVAPVALVRPAASPAHIGPGQRTTEARSHRAAGLSPRRTRPRR
jgi:hypothetical protein